MYRHQNETTVQQPILGVTTHLLPPPPHESSDTKIDHPRPQGMKDMTQTKFKFAYPEHFSRRPQWSILGHVMPSHKMHELTKFDGPWPHSKNNIIQTQYRHTISEGGHSDLRLDHDIPSPLPRCIKWISLIVLVLSVKEIWIRQEKPNRWTALHYNMACHKTVYKN